MAVKFSAFNAIITCEYVYQLFKSYYPSKDMEVTPFTGNGLSNFTGNQELYFGVVYNNAQTVVDLNTFNDTTIKLQWMSDVRDSEISTSFWTLEYQGDGTGLVLFNRIETAQVQDQWQFVGFKITFK